MKRLMALALALMGGALILTGCEKGAPQATGTLPPGVTLAAAPADAKHVTAVKQSAKDGERVTIHGVIGGRKDPIAGNRAILTLLDPSLKTCNQVAGDTCTTPWDACCESADIIAKNTVTIQIVDADGNPVKASLSGVKGVSPLAKITVTGIAKPSPDGASMIVNADGIYVEK